MVVKSKVKIPKSDYEKLEQRSTEEVKDYIANVAIKVGLHPAGYGCYRESLFRDGDDCYVTWDHFDSCD